MMGLGATSVSYIVYLMLEIATVFPGDVTLRYRSPGLNQGRLRRNPCSANCSSIILAGLGAIVHGFIPGLMTRTGSNMIRKLHGEMTNRKSRVPAPAKPSPQPHVDWQLEYEI
ncbi:MAG: hypothetical protein J7530_10250 [Novosphingobium sp.]|nr:hypothetical protein [Novosphingobium sp.]